MKRSVLVLLLSSLVVAAIACGGDSAATTPTSTAVTGPDVTPASVPATSTPVPTVAPPPPTATPIPPTPAPTAIPPGSGAPAAIMSRGPTTARTVALTFDAGSDRGFAQLILDTLAREKVVASFGITGQWAERNADLIARMANEGHVIINHSYDHASFTGLSTTSQALTQAQRWAELDRAEQIIAGLTGKSTKPFFRSPYGDYDASVNRDIGARGYAYNVLWTVDSRGWMGLPANDIVVRCLQMAVPGAIYVFHVGSASADAQALPGILTGLRQQGYTFVSIAEYAH